jgi:integrase/recombinase XerD
MIMIILKIFSVCHNKKHKAMLLTLFYAGLRTSKICEIDDISLDLKALTLRVRGKGNKEAICYISDEAAQAIKKYLEARPEVLIEGRRPLFITDFGQRWTRRSVSRMFNYYKQLAKIEKHGSAHVFSRHSLVSMLIKIIVIS